jgi:hypothetical protein
LLDAVANSQKNGLRGIECSEGGEPRRRRPTGSTRSGRVSEHPRGGDVVILAGCRVAAGPDRIGGREPSIVVRWCGGDYAGRVGNGVAMVRPGTHDPGRVGRHQRLAVVLARRASDRVLLQPGRRPGNLCDGRRWRPRRAPDQQPRPRHSPRLVARRQGHRVHQRPRRQRGDLPHRRRRRAPADSPGTPAATPTRPGTPAAVGLPSSPTATGSPRST